MGKKYSPKVSCEISLLKIFDQEAARVQIKAKLESMGITSIFDFAGTPTMIVGMGESQFAEVKEFCCGLGAEIINNEDKRDISPPLPMPPTRH